MYGVYFDESGTNIHNLMVVVVGMLVDVDTQFRPIASALADLKEAHISPDQLRHFNAFHATDMFEGRGKVFAQTIRPLEESRQILDQILQLPSRFHLPIAVGYMRKLDSPEGLVTRTERRESSAKHHACAAVFSLTIAESYLRARAPGRLAFAIAEDNGEHRSTIIGIKSLLQEAEAIEGLAYFGNKMLSYSFQFRPGDLPLTSIVSGFHFASKKNEPLLQLADACAFTLRRWLQGDSEGERLFNVLTRNRSCKIVGLENPDFGNGLIEFLN